MSQLLPPYPQAVIFDWDNTLIDNWDAITDGLNKVRALNGLETWSPEEARIKSARALRDSFPEWFGDKWQKMRDIFYEHFYAVHLEKLKVKSGAEELLSYLYEKDLPLFVVSSKKNVLLKKEVSHLGWDKFFTAVIGSLDVSKDKPNRMPVDYALSSLNMSADNPAVWMVGDTHVDVECALCSGCTPVLVGHLPLGTRLGVKLNFSDCFVLKTALNKWNYYNC